MRVSSRSTPAETTPRSPAAIAVMRIQNVFPFSAFSSASFSCTSSFATFFRSAQSIVLDSRLSPVTAMAALDSSVANSRGIFSFDIVSD